MSLCLDHVFILTERHAPAASVLASLGFIEGTANVHEGQGTACRRFLFSNTMLELLYINDPSEAAQGGAAQFRFPERAGAAQASPFGLVFRHANAEDPRLGFSAWEYQADYMPPGKPFLVAENSEDICEPLVVVVPELPVRTGPRPAANPQALTRLQLTLPQRKLSGTLESIRANKGIEIRHNARHHLEAEFDRGHAGQRHDLRPQLPLAITC